MLIRLAGHYFENPQHIDKLICIKGLPEDWIYREGPAGRELAPPWQADNPENIPKEIRHLCDEQYIVFRFSPIEKGREWVIDKRKVIGLKLDFGTEPGRALWSKIERYLEKTIPRDEDVPRPVQCAKDQKSPFETYLATRRRTGGIELEPMDVPVIDLASYGKALPLAVTPTPPSGETPSTPAELFNCEECNFSHPSKQGVRMHKMKKHPKKEKVGTPT